jgi:hypothetical protein
MGVTDVNLPSTYEALSGDELASVRAKVRAHPSGVDVRDLDPVRIVVAVVPVERGTVPRRYGPPLAQVTVADRDVVLAGEMAARLVRAFSTQRRVRDGWAAVVARRVGGDR